jgi:hypothetical protein
MKTNSRSLNVKIWLAAAVSILLLLLAGTASAQWTNVSGTTTNIYYNSGNVGIGGASPGVPLDVQAAGGGQLTNFQASSSGTSRMYSMFRNTGANLLWGVESSTGGNLLSSSTGLPYASVVGSWNATPFQLLTNALPRITIDSSGNVGIGTTSPSRQLTMSQAGGAEMDFVDATSGQSWLWQQYGSTFLRLYDATNAKDLIAFKPSTGYVGIGTTSPGYKLDVNGNTNVTGDITLTGTIHAKYQDVAEWVPSSEQIPVGTVVVLDTTKSNRVIASTQAYDTRVAGVVSERPGLALGESGKGKVLVATTGRVLVKADASKRPIHIGDLLVTSNLPGMAMKSEPITIGNRKMHMPGTLIGKALEPLEKGSAKILVLLSLQ